MRFVSEQFSEHWSDFQGGTFGVVHVVAYITMEMIKRTFVTTTIVKTNIVTNMYYHTTQHVLIRAKGLLN